MKNLPFHNLDSERSITYMKSLTRNWPTIKRLNAPSLTKSFSLLKGLLTHVHRIITAPSVGQNRQDVECKLLSLNPLQQPNVFRWTFVEENCHVSDHTLPKKRETPVFKTCRNSSNTMQLALNQLAPAEKKCSSARVEPRMVRGTHGSHGWSIQPSPIGY